MAPRTYLNFDLLFEELDEGRYRARVVDSPVEHRPAITFALPLDPTGLENLLLKLDPGRSGTRRASRSPQVEAGRVLGAALHEAVFDGDVALAWSRSRDAAAAQGHGLRLRLHLADAPKIAGLPWELLYDKRSNSFLAQSERTPVVRFLDVPNVQQPLEVEGPIRILAVISSPTDLTDLDTDAEWDHLHEALAGKIARGRVHVDRLAKPTMRELGRWLRTNEVHVLHFIGHGDYDDRLESGVLYFCDEYGRSAPVTSSVLGPYVHDHDPLRLIVLNACRSAGADATDSFGGMAQGLVQQQASSVVAMQFPITDRAAAAFTSEFYGAIADGFPVDQAVTYSRKALLAGFGAEWATPTVFLNTGDGRIFDPVATTAVPVLRPGDAPADGDVDTAPGSPTPDQPEPGTQRAPELETPRAPELEQPPGTGLGAATESGPHPGPAPGLVDEPDPPHPELVDEPGSPYPKDRFDEPDPPHRTDWPDEPGEFDDYPHYPPSDDGDDREPEPEEYAWVAGRSRRPRWQLPAVVAAVLVLLVTFALARWLGPGGDDPSDAQQDGDPTVPSSEEEPGSDPDSDADPDTDPHEEDPGSDEDEDTPTHPGETWLADPQAHATARYFATPPQIDGIFGAHWNDTFGHWTDHPVVVGTEQPDVAANWYLGWDHSNLYIYAFVLDAALSTPYADNPTALWRGDSVHFEFGRYVDEGAVGQLVPGDMHVMIGPRADGGVSAGINREQGGSQFPAGGPLTHWQGASTLWPASYEIEAAIPWSELGVSEVVEGQVFAANFNMSNVRELLDPVGSLDAMWSTNPTRYNNSADYRHTWGTLTLSN